MFDVFFSYSHSDNDNGWINDFHNKFMSLYKKMTGDVLKAFIDNESIMTADIWGNKIINSIKESKICVAFVSPSYIKSEWCRKEWDHFVIKESRYRVEGNLPSEAGIIVPVLLFNFDRGKYNCNENKLLEDIKKRQWFDFTHSSLEIMADPTKVKSLVERVIDIIYEIKKEKQDMLFDINTMVVDVKTNFLWSGNLSPKELTITEARKYVEEINKKSTRIWKIPSKVEIESIIDHSLIKNDEPNESSFPLKQPFNSQKYGYLHTSTLIGNKDENNYIMNVRNGHIFNGYGYKAYVRLIENQKKQNDDN